MAEQASVVGLDFGTTNSLVAFVDTLGRAHSLTNVKDNRPHPSTVWYRSGDVIVGRDARDHIDASSAGNSAISGSFVTSPKRLLRHDATVDVDGSAVDPRDVAAEVLKHLRDDAADPDHGANARLIRRAVMTIPVDLDGDGRRRLREAARKADIAVEQFVHEPLAALYGWLRSQSDFSRKVADLEGRRVLVFDWGGGTLDLTLCLIRGQKMIQLANAGDNDVGGDYFDEKLRNHVREMHAVQHGIDNVIQYETPESRTRLLARCERAKINLSDSESARITIPNYLKHDVGRNLNLTIARSDLERWTRDLIDRGLSHIDRLLEEHQISPREVELCLPTGGMVNIPAVRNGLVQRFGGRVPHLSDGDRIIAEGAAWVAHDRLRLSLAKPIELVQPDASYLEIVAEDQKLPVENQDLPVVATQFYCVDPRDGVANFQFVRPKKVGYGARTSDRETYVILPLQVDPYATPFVERLKLSLNIDHNYVVHIEGESTGRGARAVRQIHNLEFALTLPVGASDSSKKKIEQGPKSAVLEKASSGMNEGSIFLRSNITASASDWRNVPGDIIEKWRTSWFDRRNGDATLKQIEERNYFSACSVCKKLPYAIKAEGCQPCGIQPAS